jgi:hypothetical protein
MQSSGDRVRRGRAPAIVIALAALGAVACTSLPGAEPGTCGNGLVEPDLGEDCDRSSAGCGAPGTAAACRLTCTTTAECPATAACDAAGTCVVAAGTFTRVDEQAVNGAYLRIGDLDGNDDPELIAIDDVRIDIRAGAVGATFDPAVLVPNEAMLVPPVLADVDDDGNSDLITSVGFAVNLARGDEAELLSPTLQRAATTEELQAPLWLARLRYTAGGDRVLGTALVGTLSAGPSCGVPAGCPVLAFGSDGVPLAPGRALGRLASGDLPFAWTPSGGADPSSALVALAFADGVGPDDSSVIDVFRLTVAPTAGVAPVASITGQAVREAFVGDLDRDGRLDVVIESELLAGRTELRVARGTATGFEPARQLRLSVDQGGSFAGVAAAVAWLDLDGDGDADLITEDGGAAVERCTVGLTFDCEVSVVVSLTSFSDSWEQATTADVNGDGRRDLVAVRGSRTTIDVAFAGAAANTFTMAPFLVTAPVIAMWSGDFDGNGADDIAMLTSTIETARVDLRVAYGVVGGLPGTPVRTGAIARPAGVAVDNLGFLSPVDGAEDLVIYTEHPGGLDLTFVFGSASQRMTAPLYPAAEPTPIPIPDSITAIAALAAIPLDGPDVIAALAVHLSPGAGGDPDVHGGSIRFYTTAADGSISERRSAFETQGPALALLGSKLAVLATPGVAPRVAAIFSDGRGAISSVTGCPTACAFGEAVPLGGAGTLGVPIAIEAVALDDTGPGLVALTVGEAEATGVVVWRDPLEEPVHIALPPATVPVAVTSIAPAGGGVRTLAVATLNRGLLLIAPDPAGGYLAPVEAAMAGIIDAPVRIALDVEAVDVDGDHLDDLVIGIGSESGRLRQIVTYTQSRVPGGAGLAAGEGQ